MKKKIIEGTVRRDIGSITHNTSLGTFLESDFKKLSRGEEIPEEEKDKDYTPEYHRRLRYTTQVSEGAFARFEKAKGRKKAKRLNLESKISAVFILGITSIILSFLTLSVKLTGAVVTETSKTSINLTSAILLVAGLLCLVLSRK